VATRAKRDGAKPRKAAAANGAAPSEAALQDLLEALIAARKGDFSQRMSIRQKGLMRDIAINYNELIEAQARVTKEIGRLAKIIGREGRMTERAVVPAASGEWAVALESVNDLIDDLVRPTTEIARVMDAVADGDLSQKMQLKIGGQPVKGEFLRIGTPAPGVKLISGMLTVPASPCRCHHSRGSTGSIDCTSRSNSKFISRATTLPVESDTEPVAYGPMPSLAPRLWRWKA
jgi:methyl-accepting chemotaxis protein